ncbi:MAG: hypothetical protein IAG13_06405 [Deltaproteobacteria bacterium]|nr:hypothetical protein [Nannocystaceae bacterium]
MVWRRWGLATLWLSGCYAADEGSIVGESYMEEDFPPWSCMDGSTTGACETSGGAPATSCQVSADCPSPEVCVAAFDGDIGTLRCEPLCVLDLDEISWCSDDAACCNPDATCVRGLCIADESTGSGEVGTDETTSTGGSTT